MKFENLVLSNVPNRNKFLKACVPVEAWQEGHEEAKTILDRAETSEQFIDLLLNSDTMRGTQIYAELSKDQPYHRERVIRDIENWCPTVSDAGGLRIGNNGFTVNIPNGMGDGDMFFSEVGKGCFNADMLNFWTSIEGHAIDVYDYDCTGGKLVTSLDGRYGVFYGYGLVVFERWGDAA